MGFGTWVVLDSRPGMLESTNGVMETDCLSGRANQPPGVRSTTRPGLLSEQAVAVCLPAGEELV